MLRGGVREFLRGLTCPDVPRDTDSRSSSRSRSMSLLMSLGPRSSSTLSTFLKFFRLMPFLSTSSRTGLGG